MGDVELEPSSIAFRPAIDRRPHMPDPPPVWLLAVEDVHVRVPAEPGLAVRLDGFYVDLLRFERDGTREADIIYRAENGRLYFDVVGAGYQREDFRPIAIDVPSLAILQQQLIEREIDHEWQRGLSAARDTLLLQDPAGNWVALTERREVR
jgi:hypothetical protein